MILRSLSLRNLKVDIKIYSREMEHKELITYFKLPRTLLKKETVFEGADIYDDTSAPLCFKKYY